MVEAAINHKAVEVKAPEGSPSEYFGTKVFGREAMRRYLNKTVYAQLLDTMQRGTPLTLEVADGVAAGMRQWALDHGADHYTHWFHCASVSLSSGDGLSEMCRMGFSVFLLASR